MEVSYVFTFLKVPYKTGPILSNSVVGEPKGLTPLVPKTASAPYPDPVSTTCHPHTERITLKWNRITCEGVASSQMVLDRVLWRPLMAFSVRKVWEDF